jgi:hypothetical protein
LSWLYKGDTDRALKIFEEGLLSGRGHAQNHIFLHVYASREENNAVLLGLYAEFGADAALYSLLPIAYRAYTDPEYDFETERAEIERRYRLSKGADMDWSFPWHALIFKNYSAMRPSTSGAHWWLRWLTDYRNSEYRKHHIRKIGLPEYWRAHGFPPQCRPIGDTDFECD